jgi:hypothetical protein
MQGRIPRDLLGFVDEGDPADWVWAVPVAVLLLAVIGVWCVWDED